MRVIAGTLRGRRLIAPRGLGTRPTSDRVREALFMVLEPWEGRRVVDLFAGSGALGIEALSRGAIRVDFVESAPEARRALEQNLEALALGDLAGVWPVSLPAGLGRLRGALEAADVVLLDPPYGDRAAGETLEALGRPGTLASRCRVVLEHHVKDSVPARVPGLVVVEERAYGQTQVTFYEPQGEGP